MLDFGTLYTTHCAGCHGSDGTLGPAPPLNDPLFLQIVTDGDLEHVITEGRSGTPMPAFGIANGGPLTPAQVKAIIAGLKSTWSKPGGPADVPSYASSADKGNASQGVAVFARACAGCHGDKGQGGTFEKQTVGAVNNRAYLALTSDEVLRRFIITGRPDLGMPNFADHAGRAADFKPLTSQDVADLTALLVSWRHAARVSKQ